MMSAAQNQKKQQNKCDALLGDTGFISYIPSRCCHQFFLLMFEGFFSFPTRSVFPLLLLSGKFSNKCIHGFLFIHTDKCPSCTRQVSCQLSTIKNFWHVNLYVSRLYSQTHSLEARPWEVSQPFPHFQKKSALAFVSRCIWIAWQLT